MDPVCTDSSASSSSRSSDESTSPKPFLEEMKPIAPLPPLELALAPSTSPASRFNFQHLQCPIGQRPLGQALPPLSSIQFNGLLYPQPLFGLPAPSFTDFHQRATSTATNVAPSVFVKETELIEATKNKPETAKPVASLNLENLPPIALDSRYKSYAEFEAVFQVWRENGCHPFRIASSESLKEPNGRVNPTFRYRYVVFHCAHYGEPRVRGAGKRPNQNYLPCGCQCMLRLNFNFSEQSLRITTLVTEHGGHPVTREHYQSVISKLKAAKRSRTSECSVSSQDSLRISPDGSLTASTSNSSQASSQTSTAQHSPVQSMGHLNADLMRQQLFQTFLKQQQAKMAQEASIVENQTNSSTTGILTAQNNIPAANFQSFVVPQVGFRHCFPEIESAQMSPAIPSESEAGPAPKRTKVEQQASTENRNMVNTMQVVNRERKPQALKLSKSENTTFEDTENMVKDTIIDVPPLPGLPKIETNATFANYAQFEAAFEHWKDVGMHPFRVASSETMKELDGTVNHVMRYRYVVFHCAHYGEPRMRGAGLRPNQSYLPCGCGAMLRLNYSFGEQALKITSLVAEHRGHPRDREYFEKVLSKLRAGKSNRRHSELPIKPVAAVTATRRVSDVSRSVHSDSESSRASRGSGSPPSVPHEEKAMGTPNLPTQTASNGILPVLNAQNLFLQQQLIQMIMINQQKAAINFLSQNQQSQSEIHPELAGLPRPIAKHSTPFLDMMNLPHFTATGVSNLPVPSVTPTIIGSEKEMKRLEEL